MMYGSEIHVIPPEELRANGQSEWRNTRTRKRMSVRSKLLIGEKNQIL